MYRSTATSCHGELLGENMQSVLLGENLYSSRKPVYPCVWACVAYLCLGLACDEDLLIVQNFASKMAPKNT